MTTIGMNEPATSVSKREPHRKQMVKRHTKRVPMSIPANSAELDAAWKLFEWNGSVRLTAKRGDCGITGGVIKSKAALYRAVQNLEAGGWDIYVGANPARGTRVKAATREVEVWRYVVIDLDPIAPECPAELAIEQVLKMGLQIVERLVESAVVVYTGRGAQAWISIGPCSLRDSSERAAAERGMGAFLHQLRMLWGDRLGYRVDTSTSDLARIVRCPGTINTKTGRRARLHDIHADRASSTGSILPVGAAILPDAILGFAGPPPPEPTPVENCSNLNKIAPHLNERARQFLRMGLMEGERHKSAYAAAANLRELGVAFDQALFWVRRGGCKCHPKLYANDCDHCVREAWKGR